MVAAYEILIVTNAVRNLIREGKSFRIDSTIQTSRDKGMQLLDDHLVDLYRDGIIERTAVMNRCRFHSDTAERINQIDGEMSSAAR